MIIECNVWCVGNTKELVALGLPELDEWMPFAFESDKIIAVKLAGENDFIGNDKACVHFSETTFIVDIPYKTFIELWRKNFIV